MIRNVIDYHELTINEDRLWRSLTELARIGATPGGGVCRLAFTDLDSEARRLFSSWCEEAGCAVRVDRIGNIFARRPGRNTALSPVMFGSHLDTVPTGGRFDGILGVLAGLEIIRTLNDADAETEAPLELAVFANEEGCRFAPGMLGSAVFAGLADIEFALSRVDNDGVSIRQELDRLQASGDLAAGHPTAAFLELHVEQGPDLGDSGTTIGVVTGSSAVRLYEITITGVACHIGPMPMNRRRNALVGAARIILEGDRIGRSYGNSRASSNFMRVHPNVNNVIPDEVVVNVDFRNTDQESVGSMEDDLNRSTDAIAKELDMDIRLHRYWKHGPVTFDARLADVIRAASDRRGYSRTDLQTIGGHDAINVNRCAPSAMIMVPSKDGLSHNEAEFTDSRDCAAGANVLLEAVVSLAMNPFLTA